MLSNLPQIEISASPSFSGLAIKEFVVSSSHNVELFYDIDEVSMLRNWMDYHQEQKL